jgi:hypothetical protein
MSAGCAPVSGADPPVAAKPIAGFAQHVFDRKIQELLRSFGVG